MIIMMEFRTSLLREKFVITEKADKSAEPVIAMSNRIAIPLISEDKIDNETYVVRTQNMHSCARLAAAITKEFFERGTIANRAIPMNWEDIWLDVIKGYERDWNPDIWCCIYHRGRVIYQKGEHHPFLDIIEQCDAANKSEYVESVKFAEEAFSQAGKEVHIDHETNVALITSCAEEQAKCGIIIRSAGGATTFNYTAVPKPNVNKPIHAHTTLTVAAAFLEGVQLSFKVGLLNKKQEYRLIEKYSDEYRQYKRTHNRLVNLDRAIGMYENKFNVNYRPDRPIFKDIVEKAEATAVIILKDQIDEKNFPNEWVE
jgi:hypothetical protein